MGALESIFLGSSSPELVQKRGALDEEWKTVLASWTDLAKQWGQHAQQWQDILEFRKGNKRISDILNVFLATSAVPASMFLTWIAQWLFWSGYVRLASDE